MLATEFRSALPELIQENVRVRFVGDSSYFPDVIKDTIAQVESGTQHCSTITLNLLFCYGARSELVHAARSLAQKVKDGVLAVQDITEESLGNSLWSSSSPDPDLIIRTGNTVRTSNFMLYQGAYSEYMFLEQYWPEVTEDILAGCIEKFADIKRNFGR